jgi:DNA-binding NtrC family response regulator
MPKVRAIDVYLLAFATIQENTLANGKTTVRRINMRPAILSVSREKVSSPIRNAVLAHAGYGVIPVSSAEAALQILASRHVCGVIISPSISDNERHIICQQARGLAVPVVVLDPYETLHEDSAQAHVNPLDGPENFLSALDAVVKVNHSHGRNAVA